jgi:hypothetical protein
VRFRIARTGKVVQGQRLLILRGFVRAQDGWMQTFTMRAMLDSGAEANFIAPSLAKKVGARVTKGDFGVAVEAFGGETKLDSQISGLQIGFHGAQPGSGLAQEFEAPVEVLVAPGELSHAYEMLLGQPFLEEFGARLQYGARGCIELTARNGTTTRFTRDAGQLEDEDGAPEECREEDQAGLESERRALLRAALLAKQRAVRIAAIRPLTASQRRSRTRDERQHGEEDARRAARALKEAPELVMSVADLEKLWRTAAPGTYRITPILSCGFQETARAGPQVRTSSAHVSYADAARGGAPTTSGAKRSFTISQVTARGAQAAKAAEATQPPAEESDVHGALPLAERARAEACRTRLVAEYPDVFTPELPPLHELKKNPDDQGVQIVLKDGAQPVGRYGPRMTQADTEAAGKMIEELLAKGFIRKSRSPWGAPMFLVDKPDGTKRMVIDYRGLNASTVRNRYPLPRVDELFDQLQGARYFSKIDLRTGYWQIRMAEDSIEKTAFTSRHGHYEWLVLPMGLTNAPAEFMRLMETTFEAELNKFVLVFLDDILIYSKTLEEHEQHLRAALGRLRERGLHAKLSKCTFLRAEVEFLGHYVGRDGVRMVEGKVEAVRAWPTPTKQKDVEQFIGLAGYYRRFIKDFSALAKPLTELCGTLKKTTSGAPPVKKFYWGSKQQEAFDALKTAVSGAPCLAMPDPERDFIVHPDASGYATGAVLMQRFDEGLRPIAFLSKRMKPAEQRYPVYEQELLAILNALRAWRHYLGGRHFTVWTDHQSLQYVEASAMATPRQVRGATWVSEFDFSVKYTPGSKNVVADSLSRAGAGGAPAETDTSAPATTSGEAPRLLLNALTEMAPLPVRVRRAAASDENYQEMLERDREYLAEYKLAKAGGLLYRNVGGANGAPAVLVVPESAALRTWMLGWAHDALEAGHRGGTRVYEWLASRVWWPKMRADAQAYCNGCEMCQRDKPCNRGRQGLPQSLDVPRRAGEVICIDFIGPLTRTPDGSTSIMVVVDKLTRYVMYIPLGDGATAQEVFGALDEHWLAVFGVPRVIVSDRDSRFTSKFWENLWAGLRTELRRSTAFHPQTDGQTERANRTLIEALRAYVEGVDRDWRRLLPQLQRAANASISASTGFSPDYMMFGTEMQSGMDAELEADGVAARHTYPGAQQVHVRRAAAEATAREVIAKAQSKQRHDSARGRRAPTIKVDDLVWLSNKNLKKAGARPGERKLEALYYGPYRVLEMRGENAARLQLPEGSPLHPVFNLDLLKPYIDGAQEFPQRPVHFARPGPVPEEDPEAGGPAGCDPVYEVERVIAKKGVGAQVQYPWYGKDGQRRRHPGSAATTGTACATRFASSSAARWRHCSCSDWRRAYTSASPHSDRHPTASSSASRASGGARRGRHATQRRRGRRRAGPHSRTCRARTIDRRWMRAGRSIWAHSAASRIRRAGAGARRARNTAATAGCIARRSMAHASSSRASTARDSAYSQRATSELARSSRATRAICSRRRTVAIATTDSRAATTCWSCRRSCRWTRRAPTRRMGA